MSVSLAEFIHGFDPSEHERLDDGCSNREVYAVGSGYSDELGFEGEYVVKCAGQKFRGNARTQNRKELRAYIESIERGQDFLPSIVGGSSDFEYIMTRRINPVPVPDTGHPWRENPARQRHLDDCRDVIPEGWTDNDNLERGYDEGKLKVMDGGDLHRSDWIVRDPLQHELVEDTSIEGHEYFSISV
jgi:hypothetical protein